MIRFLKSFALFIPFAFLMYWLGIIIWGEVAPIALQKNLNYKLGSYGHMYSRIEEVRATTEVDILFLGSSHTYRGFDPRIFYSAGWTSFNLGSSSQSPLQTEILLKRYLDQLNPKKIVYEVCPSIFSTDGVEASLDLIANDEIDSLVIQLAFQQNHIKVYNTLLFGFYRKALRRNQNFKELPQKAEDTYIKGGFVEREKSHYHPIKFIYTPWEFKDEQLAAFERVVTMIKSRNIELHLVQSPISKAKYPSFQNRNDFDTKMKEYGQYYNFNINSVLNDSLHFYDEQHLNQDGVSLFNEAFIQQLR